MILSGGEARATAASRSLSLLRGDGLTLVTALVPNDEGREIVASEFSVRTSPIRTPQAALVPRLNAGIPVRGDRIECLGRFGAPLRGTVFFADEEQILVSFDSGAIGRVDRGRDGYRILPDK